MGEQKSSARIFTRQEIDSLLSASVGQTLEQVDKARLFALHEGKSKVTGIAGDIIEISVLGCERDSKQEPDIVVDGVQVELKTTGLIKPKKKDSLYLFECKEPVSITAVSIPVIVKEEFETSNFWHKLAHVLWVYYWYKSPMTVKLDGYKNFPILGFQFYEFEEEDRLRLKQDWLLVRDFLIVIHRDYPSQAERETQYPRLSHELRSQLMLIDTAPKYPHPPRFRLKRSFATVIANTCFTKKNKLEKLANPITKYADVDAKCEELNKAYVGKTFAEIAKLLNVPLGNAKNFAELVVLKMFGGKSKRLNKIDDFVKIGLVAKSLPLKHTGTPKESMKMFTPNFVEWVNEESFEESFLHDYFAEHQFIFIIYQYEDQENKDVSSIKFVGFKRVMVTDEFIETQVRSCWEEVRSLIKEKRLVIEKKFREDGSPIINPNGEQKEGPNFPKEAEYDVFLRGSGKDSSNKYKTLEINGLRMLPQEVWLSKRATLDFYLNQKL